MKDKLSSLDYKYLVTELQHLVPSRLDKISNDEETWYLEFYVTAKGKQILKVVLGKYLCLISEKEQAGADNFCEYLRKYIAGTKVKSIKQLESERIIQLDFEFKGQTYALVIEMFSKGNIILLDNNDGIMRALNNQSFKDREVKPQVPYKYPKSKYNLLLPNKELFIKILEESNKDSMVKTLATDIGLGGTYAEEVCLKSGIDKNKKKLSDKEQNAVFKTVTSLLDAKPKPHIILDNQSQIDVVPISLDIYNQKEQKSFENFNQAVAHYFSKLVVKKPSIYEKEIQKLAKIIENEQVTIAEYETQELEEKQKADAIYEKYQQIEEILRELKKARQKYSWKDIKEKLEGHTTIKSINERDGKVEIELS